ncbi:MAG: phosphatidylinositol transfer protein [Polyangiaceae bacterium]
MSHDGGRRRLGKRALALGLVGVAGCAGSAPTRAEVPVSRGFRNAGSAHIAASRPNHRARDRIVAVGEPQWIIGKFAYGKLDRDLCREEVEVAARPEGGRDYAVLGVVTTTDDGEHAEVDGAHDSGGRVYFRVPEGKALGLGRHEVRLRVLGDGTEASLVVHVVPRGTKLVVSDVDGTLTTAEAIEVAAFLRGVTSPVRVDAARALGLLAERGYVPVYLTARPEWLVDRTRTFLSEHGFPKGIVRTKDDKSGAIGPSAAEFKKRELELLRAGGLEVAFGFGNRSTDVDAYAAYVSEPTHRYFVGLTDDPPGALRGGRGFASYTDVLPDLARVPAASR